MSDQPAPEVELLHAAFAAFNARDIDAALALMTPDVVWSRAFKGGLAKRCCVRIASRREAQIKTFLSDVNGMNAF